MRRLAATQEDDESSIDLTPMLDVVFIMLIFFIVTATFIKEIGLDVNSPDPNKTPPPPDPDKKSIVVKITNRDRILIAQRDVDFRSVRANIERLHVPHKESSTGALIHIMDSARQAGVYDVKLGSIAGN